MASILRDMPFSSEPDVVSIPASPVIPIFANQIIVWISIARRESRSLPLHAARIPAVLDTGFNGAFLIQEQQLNSWCGIMANRLPLCGRMQFHATSLPMREADVWLHPNLPGKRDQFTDDAPFRFELDLGIGVWPAIIPGAKRLPLLGVQALRHAGLQLNIDFRAGRLSLRTPRRWWLY